MLVGLVRALFAPGKAAGIEIGGRRMTYRTVLDELRLAALFPLLLCAVTLWGIWWYVVIHPMADVESIKPAAVTFQKQALPEVLGGDIRTAGGKTAGARLGASETAPAGVVEGAGVAPGDGQSRAAEGEVRPRRRKPAHRPEFYTYFWIIVAATALLFALVLLEDGGRTVRVARSS